MRTLAVLTAFVAIVVFATATKSGQTKESSVAVAQAAQEVQTVQRPQVCKSAEKAIVYYRARAWKYQRVLGDPLDPTYHPERKKQACAYKRFAATKWQGIARRYKVAYDRYLYHYAWWTWLPAKWQRIARCETGYQGGTGPGESRWDWNSGTYQGAFGFYHGTWDAYKPVGAPSEAYLATPRQQYQAALNVYNVHGYDAWGCGGA